MLGLTYFFGSLALLIGGYAVYDTVVHPILKSSDAILVRACGNSWWAFPYYCLRRDQRFSCHAVAAYGSLYAE